ncbi:MAG: sugar-binding domain-containing protein [Eubacterium sp.]
MEKRLLLAICQMYYEQNMTQQQISKETGLSRMKISRTLQKAREDNIVKIIIDYSGTYPELENTLKNHFHLDHVIIAENCIDGDSRKQVESVAALHLMDRLFDGATVAVGWGTTLLEMSNYLRATEIKDLLFAPIIGGHSISLSHVHCSSIASRIAHKVGGRSISFNAPALVKNLNEKESFLKDDSIRLVIDHCRRADIAVFSLGNPTYSSSTIHRVEYFTDDDLHTLKDNQAVCDLVSIAFLNPQGEECCKAITDRTIGITPADLKGIAKKICVAEGESKHPSILAALRAGYVNDLITDKATADYLIQNL